METSDFYREQMVPSADPWSSKPWSVESVLKEDVLTQLRKGPLEGVADIESAPALTRLVHNELEDFGTNGKQDMSDDQIALAQKALKSVLARLGVRFDPPWRNFGEFRTYWQRNGGYGSWQARRNLLADLFSPVYAELDRLEEAGLSSDLAEGVSPHSGTGWPEVDTEVRELRRLFRTSSSPQDYRDVGNRCVGVLEAISRTVFDPSKHLRPDEKSPPVDKTKIRIGRYVEDSLGGQNNAEVRAVAIKVIELAHKIKHSPTPTRRDAGIAADSVVLLANILRRVDQEM